MARRVQFCTAATALLVCCALATTAAALRDEEAPAGAAPKLPARRLLQPFDLGLPAATRRSGNVGNTREGRINANNNLIAGGVDTSRRINNTIRARTATLGETTNMNFGGAGKTTYTVNAATTNTTSETETGVDVRSIGAVGPGITASRAVDSSSSLASRRTKPAGPLRDPADLDRFQGPTDNVPAGAWKVLGAGASDYAFAGDYDYSIITSIIGERGTERQFVGDTGIYDYDYGQPRLIPETSAVTTRTASRLNNEAGRAAGFGGNTQTVSAPNGVARGAVITSGIVGNNAARLNDDIFGNTPVFIPPNPIRMAGASVAGAGITRTYKGSQRPGFATNTQNAGTTVSRNYISGGAATQRNYAQANQAVSVRSQNVALSGQENIDLDVGRRHLLHANHAARRLHTAAAAGQKKH